MVLEEQTAARSRLNSMREEEEEKKRRKRRRRGERGGKGRGVCACVRVVSCARVCVVILL